MLWFLPWCWFVNMSFTVLWYVVQITPLLKRYERPLDGGRMLPDGSRVLGDSTTWGGLLWVIMLSAAAYLWIIPLYAYLVVLVFLGHILGSFIKRRLGKPRGAFVPVIDHGDHVLVAGGVLLALGMIHVPAFVCSVALTLFLTPLATLLGYKLHMRLYPY